MLNSTLNISADDFRLAFWRRARKIAGFMESQETTAADVLFKMLPWFEANLKRLAYGAAFILIAVFVFSFYSYRQNQTEIAAGEALTQVLVSTGGGGLAERLPENRGRLSRHARRTARPAARRDGAVHDRQICRRAGAVPKIPQHLSGQFFHAAGHARPGGQLGRPGKNRSGFQRLPKSGRTGGRSKRLRHRQICPRAD